MKNIFTKFILSITVLFFTLSANASNKNEWWQEIEKNWKQSVVSVQMSWKIYLNMENEVGSNNATAFIVDAKNGYVVTNAHVVGVNPGYYNLIFFNNEKVKAKLKYVDPWHDFAILKYDPEKISFKAKPVILGAHSELHEGDEVLMIGNSSNQGLSTKQGTINKLFVNKYPNPLGRHSHHFHTSLPRAGGASGSPIWNKVGHVVGLHTSGDEQESFELRIDYITDALRQIQDGKTPVRGDTYIKLQTTPWSQAEQWLLYPRKFVDEAPKENVSEDYVMIVGGMVNTPMLNDVLKISDIVMAIKTPTTDFRKIGYSVYDFDKIVNESVGQTITLKIFRREGKSSKLMDVNLKIYDANNSFEKRYANFAGAVFQNISPAMSIYHGYELPGVFLSHAYPGSTFYEVGDDYSEKQPGRKFIVINEVNSVSVKNIDELKREINKIEAEEGFTLNVCNWAYTNHSSYCSLLEMHFDEGDIFQIFAWNPISLDWDLEK